MQVSPRHQCVIYEGSPAKYLPRLATIILKRLSENKRCIYLNSPAMVAGIRSCLAAEGSDVSRELQNRRLLLSSDQSHLSHGRFDVSGMLAMLEDAATEALRDGYDGLF